MEEKTQATDVDEWDSLTHMDLITTLENELNIEFSMDEIMIMRDIKSVKDIVIIL